MLSPHPNVKILDCDGYLYRTLNELKCLMRMEDIIQHSSQEITMMEFTTEDKEKIEPVLDWCMKFKVMPFQHMNGY